MSAALWAPARISVGESEHVLAPSNAWEIKSEKQMAASGMEGEREEEEGRVMSRQPPTSII